MRIEGKTFLVTGGASGLGAACCRHLAAAGGNVVVADVDQQGAQELADALETARAVVTDVTSEQSVQAAIELARREFGGLQCAVTCAGVLAAARAVGREGPHDLALFRRVIEVNLVGTFNTVRLAAEAMSITDPDEDGARGVIVMTSSVAALEGQIGQTAYSASKGGVASMTLPLARELGRVGIRVCSIAPGVFNTPMMGQLDEEIRASLESQIPFPNRLGRPAEFAALVRHIIENPMLNGELIRLDGAMRMGPK